MLSSMPSLFLTRRADVAVPVSADTPVPFARISFALFLAGFSTFSLLYCVQPLLPEFARDFGLSPAQSSLALSLATGALALAIFTMGALSQALPRRGLMATSMVLAALLNLAAALAPSWPLLLACRLLEGLVLGGVPAVAMAYLAEEMEPRRLGSAMGLYVGGTAFGGMMGRVGMGMLVEWGSWRGALATLALIDLVAAIGFFWLLPASRRFVPQRGFDWRHHAQAWRRQLAQPALLRLFGIGFVLTSVFVALFNYLGFRLAAAPYHFGPTQISLVFLSYTLGIFSSGTSGALSQRLGRRGALAAGLGLMGLGVLVTLGSSLAAIATGVGLVTIGFFIAHAVASAWVGQLAGAHKSHAASLYLLFYYLGSSSIGAVGGWFWLHGGWPAEVALTAVLAVIGLGLAWAQGRPNQGARHG